MSQDGKQFNVVQVEQPNRNSFDLTHDYKTTLKMGQLVPVCVMECLPGDRFTLGSEALVRFAPMVAPTMQRYDARIEYFFVPNRIVWEKWMQWISSDPSGVGIPAFPTLTVNYSNYASSKLINYMGISAPGVVLGDEVVNAIPFAAYQMIWDNYYRDQNLQSPATGYPLADGNNNANFAALVAMRNRAWQHDYFTSCLPFAQKGNPVTIGAATFPDTEVKLNKNPPDTQAIWDVDLDVSGSDAVIAAIEGTSDVSGNRLYADTSELAALSITINDLREAEALQKWLEINARGGTRPNEVIKNHFNVRSSDERLQRPEYIVGVKQPVSISEVLNTTGLEISGSGSPQGTMAGHGVSMIDDSNYGSFFCEEHGFIIGIMSVIPRTSYINSLAKFWTKTTDITQYYWPTFAHIGEQPVLNREVCAFAGNGTFGYQPAYEDYRYINSKVTGDFQTSLSFWTAARGFDPNDPPQLNADFVVANPRTDIFAVDDPDVDNLYVHVLNKVFASRLVPTYGTPALGK